MGQGGGQASLLPLNPPLRRFIGELRRGDNCSMDCLHPTDDQHRCPVAFGLWHEPRYTYVTPTPQQQPMSSGCFFQLHNLVWNFYEFICPFPKFVQLPFQVQIAFPIFRHFSSTPQNRTDDVGVVFSVPSLSTYVIWVNLYVHFWNLYDLPVQVQMLKIFIFFLVL